MKVALAVSDNMMSEHFGHCDYFVIYELNGKEIINTQKIENPPHQRGFLPKFLHEKGINVVICGNMGEMANKIITQFGMNTIKCVSGSASEIIERFIDGKLESSDKVCSNHEHHEHHEHHGN